MKGILGEPTVDDHFAGKPAVREALAPGCL
jgi:hypothetical protein